MRHTLPAVIPMPRPAVTFVLLPAVVALAGLAGACGSGPPPATGPISPGASGSPREVNIIAKDYSFLPDALDLVPGETVLLHVVNGGLVVHEAVIGDQSVQDAWEVAEAATASAPPGPTPVVSVPPEVSGIRIVVASGQRVDLAWTVPADAAAPGAPPWIVGCHIPGHWARGMQIPVRWVEPVGSE
jgi:uncharacterized cupredoxin-like copper-binding protein